MEKYRVTRGGGRGGGYSGGVALYNSLRPIRDEFEERALQNRPPFFGAEICYGWESLRFVQEGPAPPRTPYPTPHNHASPRH